VRSVGVAEKNNARRFNQANCGGNPGKKLTLVVDFAALAVLFILSPLIGVETGQTDNLKVFLVKLEGFEFSFRDVKVAANRPQRLGREVNRIAAVRGLSVFLTVGLGLRQPPPAMGGSLGSDIEVRDSDGAGLGLIHDFDSGFGQGLRAKTRADGY
jgi:hypothetical protein